MYLWAVCVFYQQLISIKLISIKTLIKQSFTHKTFNYALVNMKHWLN